MPIYLQQYLPLHNIGRAKKIKVNIIFHLLLPIFNTILKNTS